LISTLEAQRSNAPISHQQWERLTPNQRAVARLVGQGRRNADIAQELGISVASVRHAMRFIHIVLRIHSRRELARAIRAFYENDGQENQFRSES
jgi:DNA-binding CsgD family transcriptional regulator